MENVYDYDRAVKQQAFFDLTMIVQWNTLPSLTVRTMIAQYNKHSLTLTMVVQ